MSARAALPLWTVYHRPADLPEWEYAARRFEAGPAGHGPTMDLMVGKTLEDVRRRLPPGLFRLPRQDNDEPHIVEVWL